MRGYVLTRYGDATAMELREVPMPTAGAGEVLIRVHAAGLNPIDYKTRQGKARMVIPLKLPRVAGSELSGVVEAVGPGGTQFSTGDRVFTRVDKTKSAGSPTTSRCGRSWLRPCRLRWTSWTRPHCRSPV